MFVNTIKNGLSDGCEDDAAKAIFSVFGGKFAKSGLLFGRRGAVGF